MEIKIGSSLRLQALILAVDGLEVANLERKKADWKRATNDGLSECSHIRWNCHTIKELIVGILTHRIIPNMKGG